MTSRQQTRLARRSNFEQAKLVPSPPPSSMSHPYSSGEADVEQLVRAFAQVLEPNSPLRRCVYLCYHADLTKLVLQKFVWFRSTQSLEFRDVATSYS